MHIFTELLGGAELSELTSIAGKALGFSYIRVSTADQADTDYDPDGFSIKAQREANQRAAEQRDTVIVAEFVDRGESAKSADRPDLQEMLRLLHELGGSIKYVFVHKVDRLARNRADDVAITLAIRQSGATLVSATENIDETPSGKLLHGIMATIAEFYSQNLATEAKKGARQKVKVGGTPYKAPIGYLNTRERVEGREIRIITVDPERAPHVRWAFSAYATGEYTLRELYEALAERGLKIPASKKLPARPLSLHAVNNMLRNRYYIGIVTYEGVIHLGRHEPLIDEETFERVQAILDARKVSGEKPKKRPHYLKGRLYCGHCGQRMGISYSRSRTGTIYPYFYCIGRQKRKACAQTFVAVETIEREAMTYWAQHVRLDEQRAADIRRVVLDWLLERQQGSGKHITAQRTRIQKLEREQQKLTQAYLADALPIEALKCEQARIQRELGQAHALIQQYQGDYESIEAALDHALLLCRIGHLAYQHAEPEVRRLLIQAAFEKLWVVDNEIVGSDLKPGFVTLLDDELAATLSQRDIEARPGATRAASGTVEYHRGVGGSGEAYADLADGTPWEDQWLELERPGGRLPWETKNPVSPAARRGSNVDSLVGTAGFEPATPGL